MKKKKNSRVYILVMICAGILAAGLIAHISETSYNAKHYRNESSGKNLEGMKEYVSTDNQTDQASSKASADPTENYIKKLSDITPEQIVTMRQYIEDRLDAAVIRDPALDYYFAYAGEDKFGISPTDYYSQNGRYVDNRKLHSMHLLTYKSNPKMGMLVFCYSYTLHIYDKSTQCFVAMEYSIDIDKKDRPVSDYMNIFDKEQSGQTNFNDWYDQSITIRKGRYFITDEEYF